MRRRQRQERARERRRRSLRCTSCTRGAHCAGRTGTAPRTRPRTVPRRWRDVGRKPRPNGLYVTTGSAPVEPLRAVGGFPVVDLVRSAELAATIGGAIERRLARCFLRTADRGTRPARREPGGGRHDGTSVRPIASLCKRLAAGRATVKRSAAPSASARRARGGAVNMGYIATRDQACSEMVGAHVPRRAVAAPIHLHPARSMIRER
jgi:hypothetical protein